MYMSTDKVRQTGNTSSRSHCNQIYKQEGLPKKKKNQFKSFTQTLTLGVSFWVGYGPAPKRPAGDES